VDVHVLVFSLFYRSKFKSEIHKLGEENNGEIQKVNQSSLDRYEIEYTDSTQLKRV